MNIAIYHLERVVLANLVDHARFAFSMVSPIVIGVLARKAVHIAWVIVKRVLRLKNTDNALIKHGFPVDNMQPLVGTHYLYVWDSGIGNTFEF